MSDQDQARGTGSLWGDMFGLGPLLKLIQDPALGANAQKALQAMIDGQAGLARIEAKLDQLLRGQGIDPRSIGPIAAVPAGEPGGHRIATAPGGASDDGASRTSPAPVGDRAAPGRASNGAAQHGAGARGTDDGGA